MSQGAGGENDLYMTYTFEWVLEEGTSEVAQAESRKQQTAMSKVAVESTIEVMRRLATEGKI